MINLSIEDLGGIINPSLQKRISISKIKLWAIVFVWFSVASYSFFATFWGYKIINLGNTSFVLAFASQFFTVVYAIPEIGNIKKKIFNKKTLFFWIILCISAHSFSFLGSAFYHYVLTIKVQNRTDFATPTQLELLHETQRKVLFNTGDYKNYLNSLKKFYETKKVKSDSGSGVSLMTGQGKRYDIFKTVVGALDEEISMAEVLYPNDQIIKITDPNIRISDFIIILSSMSVNFLHPNSKTESLASATQNFDNYKRVRPEFDYGKDEDIPDPKIGRERIKNYLANYPFVQVKIPYELTSGGSYLGSIDKLLSMLQFWKSETGIKYSKSFGLIAAVIIEIATFIFNLFLIVQDTNLKMITKRLNRSSILYNAMERAKSTIVHFSFISDKIEKLDLSYPVMLILLAKEQVFFHTDMKEKIQFSDSSFELALPPKREKRSIFGRALHKVRIAHEAYYYCINPEWTKKITNFSGIDVDEIEFKHYKLDKPLDRVWKASVISMITYLLRYFTTTQELIEKDNKYWVDMSDFDDWFSTVQEKTDIRGVNLPELDFEEKKMTIQEFYNHLRSVQEKNKKNDIK